MRPFRVFHFRSRHSAVGTQAKHDGSECTIFHGMDFVLQRGQCDYVVHRINYQRAGWWPTRSTGNFSYIRRVLINYLFIFYNGRGQ